MRYLRISTCILLAFSRLVCAAEQSPADDFVTTELRRAAAREADVVQYIQTDRFEIGLKSTANRILSEATPEEAKAFAGKEDTPGGQKALRADRLASVKAATATADALLDSLRRLSENKDRGNQLVLGTKNRDPQLIRAALALMLMKEAYYRLDGNGNEYQAELDLLERKIAELEAVLRRSGLPVSIANHDGYQRMRARRQMGQQRGQPGPRPHVHQ